MMGLLWFVLGILVGAAAAWYWRGREVAARGAEIHASWEQKYKHLQAEVGRADAEHEETKERLRLAEKRLRELEAELAARSRPASPQPTAEDEAQARWEDEGGAGSSAGIADDLTRVRGIGPKIAQKLAALGITSLHQLARLSPEEIARIDGALAFRGRIHREKWVEQARDLLRG